ncbi:MAG: hypothetical protein QF541_09205, partial [Lentisphaeria bacterium]|nr:hypothetical protein [Lentisphaeria bacterium]
MNKRLTTMAMAVITMLVMPISAFAQLDDGDKINVFAISQQMQGRGLLSLVHMINVDNNMGQQEINSMLNFDIQGGAVTPPKNQDSRQHFLTEAFARDDGNEQWNQIRFQDYDRGNAIYTREFAVKTDCTIDFRIGAGSPVIEERLPFMRNGYTSMAADGSIFLWVTIDDPRCSGGAADSGGGAGFISVSGSRVHDVAEVFDLETRDGVVPGSVMSVDALGSGRLMPAAAPYDRKVVGVISGAGEFQHAMLIGSREDGSHDLPVALSGQVYVRVSAENGPISPGDLLVSSSSPGVAMA